MDSGRREVVLWRARISQNCHWLFLKFCVRSKLMRECIRVSAIQCPRLTTSVFLHWMHPIWIFDSTIEHDAENNIEKDMYWNDDPGQQTQVSIKPYTNRFNCSDCRETCSSNRLGWSYGKRSRTAANDPNNWDGLSSIKAIAMLSMFGLFASVSMVFPYDSPDCLKIFCDERRDSGDKNDCMGTRFCEIQDKFFAVSFRPLFDQLVIVFQLRPQ